MRLVRVVAHAFGPLVEQTLELAPGMTVVVGANESAKSSWHAAMYAALCGRRRGKGPGAREDRRFVELHRPWDSPNWQVSAEVELADGSRVELRHDLDGRVDCRATDLSFGHDRSAEIMFEGAPDGSRWLGLDRRSFLATACVNQTELLAVLGAADGLQEQLQRAAATAGTTDSTAARALELLERYRRDHVGRDVAHSIKPLRSAREAVRAAEATLVTAREHHEGYLVAVTAAETAECAAEAAEERARTLVTRVGALREVLSRAGTLRTAALDAAGRDEHLARSVGDLAELAGRLAKVEELLAAYPPDGALETSRPTATEPEEAPGGGEPPVSDPQLHAAATAVDRAAALLAEHDRLRPAAGPAAPPATLAAAVTLGAARLREIAADLSRTPPPPAPPAPADPADPAGELAAARSRLAAATTRRAAAEAAETTATEEQQRAAARAAAAQAARAADDEQRRRSEAAAARARRRRRQLLAVAAAGLVTGVALVALGALTPGAVVVAFAVAAVIAAAAARPPRPPLPAGPAGAVLSGGGEPEQATAALTVVRAAAAAARAEETDAIRAVAAAEGRVAAARRAHQEAAEAWRAVCRRCAEAGVPADGEQLRHLATEVDAYTRACADHTAWAERGAELAARLASATSALLAALTDRGVTPSATDPTSLAAAVASYEEERRRRVGASTAAVSLARGQLETLLGGATPAGLRAQLETAHVTEAAARGAVEAAAAQLFDARRQLAAAARTAGIPTPGDDDAALTGLRQTLAAAEAESRAGQQRAGEARAEAARLAGVSAQLARIVTSVAEAEERLAGAQVELARVTALGRTLELTARFLAAAQLRAHRDIAPVLAQTLTTWLPRVTAGRYTRSVVDPATLRVQVASATGPWRLADRLSVGTGEQVYLLLRVALAQHLITPGESCPLLLDDVTVQADEERTRQILELLLALSADRQVVLFAQNDSVRHWAQLRLSGDRDAVRELAQLPG